MAVKTRVMWEQVPERVRRDLEAHLGAPVVSAVNQQGGFSPGLAARVRCADGTRAFIKAVGPELNPDTPELFRAERRVAAVLPAHVPAARLLYAYDDGDWVALVFAEIDGATPQVPWKLPEVRRVLDALASLADAGTPSPVPNLPRLPDALATDLGAYARIAADPPADLDSWERRQLPALVALAERAGAALTGNSLVHMDIRSDNMLFTTSGEVVFVDWGWAGIGPPWFDSLTLLINAGVDGLDPQELAEQTPALAGADQEAVTAVLAGLSGMWAEASRRPPPPGLPTVREFQRRYWRAASSWLLRRAGLSALS